MSFSRDFNEDLEDYQVLLTNGCRFPSEYEDDPKISLRHTICSKNGRKNTKVHIKIQDSDKYDDLVDYLETSTLEDAKLMVAKAPRFISRSRTATSTMTS